MRIVLVAFYNYEAHAIRIFQPLLKARGHEVHSIFFKNYFTFSVPTRREEDMVVELVERLRPDVVAMTVWSTYFQLAARLRIGSRPVSARSSSGAASTPRRGRASASRTPTSSPSARASRCSPSSPTASPPARRSTTCRDAG
ncbi:MAG TPA: hypothetical protein VKU61_13455 [Candidatus Binatia bacterium]|nr:hypothetical protein [Candidatus Binatia bacterium]